jgi:hypothetical protein
VRASVVSVDGADDSTRSGDRDSSPNRPLHIGTMVLSVASLANLVEGTGDSGPRPQGPSAYGSIVWMLIELGGVSLFPLNSHLGAMPSIEVRRSPAVLALLLCLTHGTEEDEGFGGCTQPFSRRSTKDGGSACLATVAGLPELLFTLGAVELKMANLMREKSLEGFKEGCCDALADTVKVGGDCAEEVVDWMACSVAIVAPA